jgi:hypothetical protein
MITASFRFPAVMALILAGTVTVPASLQARQGLPPAADRVVAGVVVHSAAPAAVPGATVASAAPSGPRALPVYAWTLGEASAADDLDTSFLQDRVRAGPNIAMMAVGGAALVTGLIIGGDGGLIIAATGGVIGLIGLYRYLR